MNATELIDFHQIADSFLEMYFAPKLVYIFYVFSAHVKELKCPTDKQSKVLVGWRKRMQFIYPQLFPAIRTIVL